MISDRSSRIKQLEQMEPGDVRAYAPMNIILVSCRSLRSIRF